LFCNQEKGPKKRPLLRPPTSLWRDHKYFLRVAQPLNAKVYIEVVRKLSEILRTVCKPSRRDQRTDCRDLSHFDVYLIDEEIREVLIQLGNGRELTAARANILSA